MPRAWGIELGWGLPPIRLVRGATAGTVPAGPSPLDRGRLRARLAAGEATLGTFVGAASPLLRSVLRRTR
jgi:hypothetical protein